MTPLECLIRADEASQYVEMKISGCLRLNPSTWAALRVAEELFGTNALHLAALVTRGAPKLVLRAEHLGAGHACRAGAITAVLTQAAWYNHAQDAHLLAQARRRAKVVAVEFRMPCGPLARHTAIDLGSERAILDQYPRVARRAWLRCLSVGVPAGIPLRIAPWIATNALVLSITSALHWEGEIVSPGFGRPRGNARPQPKLALPRTAWSVG